MDFFCIIILLWLCMYAIIKFMNFLRISSPHKNHCVHKNFWEFCYLSWSFVCLLICVRQFNSMLLLMHCYDSILCIFRHSMIFVEQCKLLILQYIYFVIFVLIVVSVALHDWHGFFGLFSNLRVLVEKVNNTL